MLNGIVESNFRRTMINASLRIVSCTLKWLRSYIFISRIVLTVQIKNIAWS